MPTSSKLTVICVFNEPHLIETTLTAVYDLKNTSIELIIINDGAGVEASTIIQSLTEYYDHDETYFFEFDLVAGVGARVNEVLGTCTGDFVWIANSLGRIDEAELVDTLASLAQSKAVVATNLQEVPSDFNSWIETIQNASETEQLGFIWKWAELPNNQRFFNPFLLDSVSFELMWRLENCPYLSREASWFVPAVEEQVVEKWALKRELALHWLRSYQVDLESKERLLQVLTQTDAEAIELARSYGESLLDKARDEFNKKNYVRALNFAREAYQKEPENEIIRDYYVKVLEYLGRHIDADEIKGESSKQELAQDDAIEEDHFEINKQLSDFSEIIEEGKTVKITPPEPEIEEEPQIEYTAQYNESAKVKYSIVIPTTGYGLGLLEDCFESISNVIDKDCTEIVVIDNASLDETFSYLDDLVAKKPFRLQVITNKQNNGFAASVNQGIEKAKGEFVLVLHNDCTLETDVLHELSQVYESHPDAGAVVPMLSASLIDEQDKEHSKLDFSEVIQAIPHCDSVCILLKKENPFRFDDVFGLAYFEDLDLSNQISNAGKKIYLHTGVEVDHKYGITTGMLGITTQSDYYALNMSKFNKKWGFEPIYDPKFNQLKKLDRVLLIAGKMNPVDPEKHLFEEFKLNFTDEVKTEIVKTKWDEEYAIAIASMLMKTDQRETLRKIETQLDAFNLPINLVQDLVRYYFDRNIYSRCAHYLNQYGNDATFTDAAIYQLKIFLGERMLEEAAELLGSLFTVFPGNPELYKLLGDMHQFQNNKEEADQFYALAAQIDPFRFGKPKGSVSFF